MNREMDNVGTMDTMTSEVRNDFAKRQEHFITDVTAFPSVMAMIKWTHKILMKEYSGDRYPYEPASAAKLARDIKNFRDIGEHFEQCRACRILAQAIIEGLRNALPAKKARRTTKKI